MSGRYWGLCRAWSASLDRVSEEKSLAVAAFWKTSWTIVPFSICFEPPSKLCMTNNKKPSRQHSGEHENKHNREWNWRSRRDLSVATQKVLGHVGRMRWLFLTLNISPNTARLMQRMELEMLVPEMRLSGRKTRKPFSLSINQDPLSDWPSRWTTSPRQTGVPSL